MSSFSFQNKKPFLILVILLFAVLVLNKEVRCDGDCDPDDIITTQRQRILSTKPQQKHKRASVAGMVGTDPSLLVGVTSKQSTRGYKSSTSNKGSHQRVELKSSYKASNEAIATVTTTAAVATNASAEMEPIRNDTDVIHKPSSEVNLPINISSTVNGLQPAAVTTLELTAAAETAAANADERKFYMYELDEEFWWRWPVDGSDCSENGYVGHEHKENSGIGPLISADEGLFLTWHFSLFSSLYNRMKRSSRRTMDPEEASLFIIPYDLGLDGYLDARTCRNRRQCSQGLVGKLTALLQESQYFKRHKGADHAVLWSLGQYHPWPRAGCDIFMKSFCELCTFTCYWMDATKADNKFVSVPFPSSYHWWDGIKQLPWDPTPAAALNRTMKAVYLGSIQTLNPTHTKIRRAMTQQCNVSSDCHWLQIGHSSKDTNIADFLTAYRRAQFCLCPPGDDPARKAVSDAIVSGCIPVIFELNTLYNQYPWHIGEQAALDISVYIPGGAVKNNQIDFMSVLQKIPASVIESKQAALALIAPRVQYAMPPPQLLADIHDNTTWDPPFKDGVELTLDGMFDRTAHMVKKEPTHIPLKLLSGKEWGRIYNSVRVQVPNSTTTDYEGNIIHEQVDLNIRKRVRARLGSHRGGRGNNNKHMVHRGQALDGIDSSSSSGREGGAAAHHHKKASKFHPKQGANARHHQQVGRSSSSSGEVDEGRDLPSLGAPGEV